MVAHTYSLNTQEARAERVPGVKSKLGLWCEQWGEHGEEERETALSPDTLFNTGQSQGHYDTRDTEK